jgi:hypothetical protein
MTPKKVNQILGGAVNGRGRGIITNRFPILWKNVGKQRLDKISDNPMFSGFPLTHEMLVASEIKLFKNYGYIGNQT